jgi:non-specific serine/threonine protein kinase
MATLQGHTRVIRGVALSADGHQVASSGVDGAIRLWDVRSGVCVQTLQEAPGSVYGVALSADGALLASAKLDGTVRLLEVKSGRRVATLEGHTGVAYGVALSGESRLGESSVAVVAASLPAGNGRSGGNQGQLLASGGLDGTIRLWQLQTHTYVATLQGHTGAVWGVALSGHGQLASGGADGTVRLWDAESRRLLATLQGHSGAVYCVAFSGDGHIVASGGLDGTVRLWAADSGQCVAILQRDTGVVRGVALSASGHLLASGGQDGIIRLWDTETGTVLLRLRPDRPYERMDITGLSGVTEAQKAALQALGAVEHAPASAAQLTPAAAQPPLSTSTPVPAQARDPARPTTNLPQARTAFVGRAAELTALTQALDPALRTGTRLLTLIGVAGCGKTCLALEVAEAVLDTYPDGAWLVALAPSPASAVADPARVAAATLIALGLHEQPGHSPLDTLIEHLRPRRLLLVLDNCEHLVAACAALATRLLVACPELRILATSQLALRSAGETIWQVAPLAVPAPLEGAPTEAELALLEQSDAVRLFVARAQAVWTGFTLSDATATRVAAICRRLDGLPLAIELAAARVNVLSLEDLLTRLDDRFRLLRRGGRTTDQRHQTLQATMDWSYGLLDPIEQAVLRRLAVFAGGWDLAAAEAVIGDGEAVAAETVLDLLDALLERSLVYVHLADETPRYGLLETVRQYGLQQLERAGEVAAVRDRHLAWCATLAEQAMSVLQGPEQAVWLARLGREHDNLRAALQWALDRGQSTLGLQVAAGIWRFWLQRGHQREGRRWLAALLALAAGEDATSMALRASAFEGAARLAEDQHDFAQASALFGQSVSLRHALGQHERTTGVLVNTAMEARAQGDYAQAIAILEECLAQYRRSAHREQVMDGEQGLSLAWGYRYTVLALVLREQGEYARATALCEECLALARELGNTEGIANALLGLGDLARDQGDAGQVRAYCEESLVLFRDLDQKWAIGFTLNNLALAAYLEGDLALAASRAEESDSFFRGLRGGPSQAEVLITLGRVMEAQGEVAAAHASLTEALTLAWPKGPRIVVAMALEELGAQAVRKGHAQLGVRLLAAVAMLRQTLGTPIRPADRPSIERGLATARTTLGDATFTNAWATGQRLPLDEIVAHALAGPDGGAGAPERAGDT